MASPQPRTRRVVAAGGAAAAAAAILAISTPLIQHYEGTVLATYADPIGIKTACTGHVDSTLRLGQKWTIAQCTRMLDADQSAVLTRIGRCIKVPVPVESFAALTSFSFNVGSGVTCSKFAPLINAGNLRGACAKLSAYTWAGGRQLPGLIRRRAAERKLCDEGLT